MEKPKILIRLTSQLRGQGDKTPAINALKYLRKFGLIESGSLKLTEKGKIRNAMSPGDRAKDRASKESGHSTSDYSYDKRTNRATLKYGK
jgi:hypothetical protein